MTTRRALIAVALLSACPAAPPQRVPPTEEIYAAGPAIVDGPVGATGSSASRDAGSRLAIGDDGGSRLAGQRLAAGEACFDGSECDSGVCEGEGCGTNQPGACAPSDRACKGAEAQFCGCDGETFRAPGDCPGQPFARRGACGK
jgi:hypothetical protein